MAEHMLPPVAPDQLLCVVLAGGQGQRMGGADKGLQIYRGRPLVDHVLERLRRQQGMPALPIGINANRHLEQYAALGYPVWDDGQSGFGGPLQGICASLQTMQKTFPQASAVLFVACDTPHLPLDLLQRLFGTMQHHAAAAVAVRAGGRPHPLPCLLHGHLLTSLEQYLAQGQRKVQTWMEACGLQWVDFGSTADADAFGNFNTRADLQTDPEV